MLDLARIKWHAQELHKLLEQDPNDSQLGRLYADLEGFVLNNMRFSNIEPVGPPVEKEGE